MDCPWTIHGLIILVVDWSHWAIQLCLSIIVKTEHGLDIVWVSYFLEWWAPSICLVFCSYFFCHTQPESMWYRYLQHCRCTIVFSGSASAAVFQEDTHPFPDLDCRSGVTQRSFWERHSRQLAWYGGLASWDPIAMGGLPKELQAGSTIRWTARLGNFGREGGS